MFFTLIANICGAVNYFIPSIGVIWCTSGVSSNGGTGSGLNPGSNGITGKKRDRSPNYRIWERFQPPQKEYRLEHPRMFLNDQADEGRLFGISINAVLRWCASLFPDDPPINSFFYYPLEVSCILPFFDVISMFLLVSFACNQVVYGVDMGYTNLWTGQETGISIQTWEWFLLLFS